MGGEPEGKARHVLRKGGVFVTAVTTQQAAVGGASEGPGIEPRSAGVDGLMGQIFCEAFGAVGIPIRGRERRRPASNEQMLELRVSQRRLQRDRLQKGSGRRDV